MSPSRLIQIFASTVLFLTVTYWLLRPDSFSRIGSWHRPTVPRENLTLEVEILKKLDVPATFTYQRHCVRTREKQGLKRESLINLHRPLLSDTAVDITLDAKFVANPITEAVFPPCEETIDLEVPEFSSHAHANTSALMLGVATTLKRIEASIPAFSRWLSNTSSPLICLVVDQTNLTDKANETARILSLAADLNIDLVLEPYHPTFEFDSEGLKNFGLAPILDKHRRPNTKWYGLIDDDTFFVSLPRMLEALEPYDPTKQHYIGALTEGHFRVAKEGFKAWGGAGFFISPPLMKLLAERTTECTHLDKFFGDILWRDCILHVTSPTVHLTELRGLNQMDLWMDMSGWYEAGFTPILTVHHWKSWHQYPIVRGHTVADVAGPDSFLQRYLFTNNTVFTNAYSIVKYPKGLPDLNLVEATMTEEVNHKDPPDVLEFHHSFGRTRPKLKKGKEKISWTFQYAVMDDGRVRQFYVNKGHGNAKKGFGIVEVDWTHG
ncbi:unnamed protein product [Zymoseptoria tritici ST99CH_3D1]|nr:unnamed protein product [Zymoseptoria tritici ST99CH_3D1]